MIDRLKVERLLGELYAARLEGSLDSLCAVFATDAAFKIVGVSDGKPIAITASGADSIRPWLAMMVKTFKLSNYRVVSMIIDGDRACVQWSADIHSRITGSLVPTELVDIVEVCESGIAAYTEFFVPL